VTPTSYLELLTTFLKLLGEKRAEVTAQKRRLEVGLEKLTSTAEQVGSCLYLPPETPLYSYQLHTPCKRAPTDEFTYQLHTPSNATIIHPNQVEVMQRELQELQPVLAATAAQVESMMAQIESDKADAAATRAQVQGQEREANEQAAGAKAMAEEAQRELDAALPALDAAVASLKNLSRWVCFGICLSFIWCVLGSLMRKTVSQTAYSILTAETNKPTNTKPDTPPDGRNDIVEVKSLQNPPAGVKMVMETACIMFDEKTKMKEDPTKMGER
jgi:dynein heavy chain